MNSDASVAVIGGIHVLHTILPLDDRSGSAMPHDAHGSLRFFFTPHASRRRGIAMGLMHALGTVEVVGQHLNDPLALALAQDTMTETRVTPWYRNTIEVDRTLIAPVQRVDRGSI